jgi:hypothetical protein
LEFLIVTKIAFISQPEYFRFCYENDLQTLGSVIEIPFHFDSELKAFGPILEFDADFNIFFRGESIPDEILSSLKGIKINLSSEPFPRFIENKLEYSFDSFRRYLFFRQIRKKKFDYVFHYDEASLSFFKKDGLYLSGAFPLPVATDTYYPEKHDKNWDLFFIGRSTPYREMFFGKLKHYYNFLHIAHGIWGPPLVEYIHKSKICLNIHAESEISWEPRMQMLLATGAFVISEKITPNSILKPNIDFIEISNNKELLEAVSYYLAHEEERNKIAENGCIKVCTHLNSKNSFSNIIKSIKENKVDLFKAKNGNPMIGFCDFALSKFYWLKTVLQK